MNSSTVYICEACSESYQHEDNAKCCCMSPKERDRYCDRKKLAEETPPDFTDSPAFSLADLNIEEQRKCRKLLEVYFPALASLDDDEEMNGGDTVEQLCFLYADLAK